METGLFIACAALTAACALIAVYFMKAFREETYDRAAILKTAAAATYVKSKKADAGRLMVFGSVYMAMVVAMGAVSISAATVSVGAATLLFAVGGVMFPISDSILSAYSFGPDKHFGLNIGVHATYYLAQICIAWSLAFV